MIINHRSVDKEVGICNKKQQHIIDRINKINRYLTKQKKYTLKIKV